MSYLVCDAPTDRVQGPEQWLGRTSATLAACRNDTARHAIATNRHPGWGVGGEQPPCFSFSLPSLLFAERGQQGGFESFYFSWGFGGGAPIAFPYPGQLLEMILAHRMDDICEKMKA